MKPDTGRAWDDDEKQQYRVVWEERRRPSCTCCDENNPNHAWQRRVSHVYTDDDPFSSQDGLSRVQQAAIDLEDDHNTTVSQNEVRNIVIERAVVTWAEWERWK